MMTTTNIGSNSGTSEKNSITDSIQLHIHKIVEGAVLPERATPDSACFDVRACLHKDTVKVNGKNEAQVEDHGGGRQVMLFANDRMLVPTGLIVIVPKGYKLAVYPRSGIAFKEGISVINSPGTVDSDYSHELFILLINHGDIPRPIKNNERIAQIEIVPIVSDRVVYKDISMEDVLNYRSHQERQGGIGHTGKK